MEEKIYLLNIEDISKNPYQPRRHFDHDKLKELSQSIEVNGVLQPIIVRKSNLFGYELLAGERRLRASKLANIDKIPAIIRSYSDNEMM
ncbi:MAG: ParB/RepB/Spo0J family partition protein, partial [Lactococcus sp.]